MSGIVMNRKIWKRGAQNEENNNLNFHDNLSAFNRLSRKHK